MANKKIQRAVAKKAQTTPLLPISMADVQNKIVPIKQQYVIADADVAELYGVETKRINEAVRNNPDKFPVDYMFALTPDETQYLRTKISTTKVSTKSRTLPNVFTEKGLYMLATILKSQTATSVETVPEVSLMDSVKAVKYLWNGRIYIQRDGKVYDITGFRAK